MYFHGIVTVAMDAKKRKKFTTVSIPATLFGRIKKLIEDTGFPSVSSYVTYVLRDIVLAHEEEKYAKQDIDEDRKRIIESLKKLGYIG